MGNSISNWIFYDEEVMGKSVGAFQRFCVSTKTTNVFGGNRGSGGLRGHELFSSYTLFGRSYDPTWEINVQITYRAIVCPNYDLLHKKFTSQG
eukprot:scaffold4743_cov171-Amphora_coffeaeformis.AAC.3